MSAAGQEADSSPSGMMGDASMINRLLPRFLAHSGPACQAARELDWSATALGPPDAWPEALRSAASLTFNSPIPMFVAWGPQLQVLYNDAFSHLLGEKHPWAMGRPHRDIWAQDAGELDPFVRQALRGEPAQATHASFEISRDGGSESARATFSYAPIWGGGDEVAGFHCVCVDTTALASLLAAQTRQRKNLETLFAQSPGFMALVRGPDHVFELVNHEYLQLIGFREVIGKSVAFALPEAAEQGFVELLDKVRASGEPFEGRSVPFTLRRTEDGPPAQAFVDLVYQPLRGLMGDVDGILIQGHEVTVERQAREELLAFSDSIPAIAWVSDAQGSLQRFNRQWEAYTGVPSEQATGRGWTELVHPEDLERARVVWAAARGGTEPWEIEYRLRGRDGAYRWFLARAVPRLEAGRAVQWFGTTTDIEDLRRASQALMAADRQKDEFLATLAHELRNPLAPVRFALRILSGDTASASARANALDVIDRQVGQLAHLLDDLIDVARVNERRLILKPEPVSASDAIEAAVESARPLIERKGHKLEVFVEGPVPVAMADRVRLTQMLTNLLTNAAKYTDAGGSIKVEARSSERGCVFTVSDSGIGLAPESIASIFDMFIQAQPALERSEGGLGIGLALVKGLAELHGGSVAAASDGLGTGSRFEIAIPLAGDSGAAQPAANRPDAAASSASKVVLLADDNADAAEVMGELLRIEGHVVHVANDGLQAVELAARFRPEVAILDIGMPGLNGYEVARRIRDAKDTADCLIVAATGWGQENDRRRAFDAGFDAHLTKPLDPSALMALIAQNRSR